MPGDDRLLLAVITGPHGVRGLVKLKSFTEDPLAVADYGPLVTETGAPLELERADFGPKGAVVARVKGLSDRTGAEALKGERLYIDRAALPPLEDEEEFYHSDLVGLRAELADGTVLGVIRAVHDFGAGDVLDVQPDSGKSVMVPFTKAVVPIVDTAAGRLVVEPPPGLLDDGGESEAEGGDA